MRLRSFAVLLFLTLSGRAQEQQPRDTSAFTPLSPILPDSLKARDTSQVSGVDTLVSYIATDSIVYTLSTRTMSLFGAGKISYQDMQLQSERIHINWDTAILAAEGVPDTSDTSGQKFKGTPLMKDGGEDYRGARLSYNFRSKRGKIELGDTQIDEGYYHGEDIKKVDRNILFVKDGRYTTCDLPEPHFYFASPKMKVTFHDNVVAEPVYLYIADVPIFGLPFGVFPNQRGRRSGIIAPAYGEDGQRGRFLSHLGYYWAISDYMDLNARSDLYSKGGWALYSDYRYALLYNFRGSLSGEYKQLHIGEENDPRRTAENSYRVNVFHDQTIDPNTRMNANFTFASNNSYRNTIDLQQALDQVITSNATLSRSWEGTPNSISINVSRTQNLTNGRIDETLPSLSFNHSQSYPFRFGKGVPESGNGAWYENIGLSYSANASNSRSKFRFRVDSIKTSINGIDTVQTVEEFQRNRTRTLSQGFSINIAPKLGHITLSPSLGYRDERSFINNDVPARDASDSSLITSSQEATRRSGVISTGVSASTKLYGMIRPEMLGIGALRHTMTPGLSFTYQKQIVGSDLGGRQMFMSLNVGNNFEMKGIPGEGGKEPEKVQLLNLGLGISYNFTADSLNFSPIGVSYRTGIGSIFDVGGDAGFDLYKLAQVRPNVYTRVNKFLIREEGRFARLTNFRVSISTTLEGKQEKSSTQPPVAVGDSLLDRPRRSSYFGIYDQSEPDFSIPWRLSLSLDYSENKVQPFTSRSSGIRGDLEFNLTEKWKFSVNGGYDIFNKEIVVPNVNIARDLHCWTMNFNWIPLGNYRSYRFEIRVKSSQLQDVKVTKQGSERGIY